MQSPNNLWKDVEKMGLDISPRCTVKGQETVHKNCSKAILIREKENFFILRLSKHYKKLMSEIWNLHHLGC